MTDERKRLARLLGGLLTLVVLTLMWLAIRQGVFDPKTHFVLTVDKANGIKPGIGLEYAGFEIGKVTSVELNEDGVVEVGAWVENKHHKYLRSDSGFFLEQPFVGPAKIRVETRDLMQPPLPDGARRPLSAAKQTDQLMAQGLALAADAQVLIKSLASPTGAFQKTLVNVEALTAALQSQGLLAGAIKDPAAVASLLAALKRSQGIADKVREAADAATVAANSAGKLIQGADQRLLGKDGTVAHVEATLDEAKQTLQTLRGNLGEMQKLLANGTRLAGNVADASTELTELRERIDSVTRQVDEVLGDLQRIPPFKRSSEVKLP